MADQAQEVNSEFSLVREICAFLKLGDTGKLESFFKRAIKTLDKEMTANKKNLEILKFNHTQEIEDVDDEIEDARVSYEDSYKKVDVSQIGTNESQKEFLEKYFSKIEEKEKHLKNLQLKREKLTSKYQEDVAALEENIQVLKNRIERMSKK